MFERSKNGNLLRCFFKLACVVEIFKMLYPIIFWWQNYYLLTLIWVCMCVCVCVCVWGGGILAHPLLVFP